MKIIKNYNDFLVEKAELNEGVYDPGILKAFFMAGGPGSGKSYVATEIFDFPKGAGQFSILCYWFKTCK
jgi:hypothetical protein